MIEILTDVPPGIVAVRASGRLTREEYDAVVVPLLDEAPREGRRLRCLCEVGADYRGLTPGAAWEDVTLGLRALRLFDGCAVVSDVGWIREASRLASFLMPCPVRVFAEQDRAEAAAWLAALPEGPGAMVRLVSGSGRLAARGPAGPRAGVLRQARVGEWLVEPGPPCTRMWRWGQITGVPPDGDHLLVRWYGDSHDTVVLPTCYAQIERPDHQPSTAGDAVGLLPAA